MSSIRALERGDLDEVGALFERVIGYRSRFRPVGEFFGRTLLDQPYADPELPSLVAVGADDRIVGFVGAGVRRVRLGDRPLRMVVSSHLVVEVEARRHATGALLTRRLLDGPQDLTITDNATDVTRAIWELMGAETRHLECLAWTRILRPFTALADRVGVPLGGRRSHLPARLATRGLDALSGAAAPRLFRPTAVADPSTSLDPDALLEAFPAVTGRLVLRPEYERSFLEWLFDEVPRSEAPGVVSGEVVHDARGRALGWYVYVLLPGARSQVLQFAAVPREADRVFNRLMVHAHRNGAASISGRLEPVFLGIPELRRCLVRPHVGQALVHAREPEVIRAVRSGRSLLTRLDGEWW